MSGSPMDERPDAESSSPWTARRYGQARGALTFYRIMAYITGTFLLVLCVEMILKYGLQIDMQFGSFNLASAIAIGHGWCYVVYLIADFRLWQSMRWRLKDFLIIALGGVIPLLSFILEKRVHARASRELDDAIVLAPRDL
ncbi:DUF3817 domain-containing protein [Saxibacter everestensis]|uniref:DUF3817 domain-containing protein n=1 Tax=Saxibacter everestensis TaxID=2909229 RepID=A0ABY8QV06_9MICO|nr:DUF3817 domain-containing protein [Brevibacteriaceae bacterium ZFBP1038]